MRELERKLSTATHASWLTLAACVGCIPTKLAAPYVMTMLPHWMVLGWVIPCGGGARGLTTPIGTLPKASRVACARHLGHVLGPLDQGFQGRGLLPVPLRRRWGRIALGETQETKVVRFRGVGAAGGAARAAAGRGMARPARGPPAWWVAMAFRICWATSAAA